MQKLGRNLIGPRSHCSLLTASRAPLLGGWWLVAGGWWLCGYVAMWLCGHVAVWLCGHVAAWQCGCVAMWLCGYVAVWLCGYVWLQRLCPTRDGDLISYRRIAVSPRRSTASMVYVFCLFVSKACFLSFSTQNHAESSRNS